MSRPSHFVQTLTEWFEPTGIAVGQHVNGKTMNEWEAGIGQDGKYSRNRKRRHSAPPWYGRLVTGATIIVTLLVAFFHLGADKRKLQAATESQSLWAIAQQCDAQMEHQGQSIDGTRHGFDGKTATCTWDSSTQQFSWALTEFEDTAYPDILQIEVEIAFYLEGWSDQQMVIGLSPDNGATWREVARYDQASPPPTSLSTLTYDLTGFLSSQSEINAAWLRIYGDGMSADQGEVKVYIDAARWQVVREIPPTATASPTETPTVTPSPIPSFTPTDMPTAITVVTPTATISGSIPITVTPTVSPTVIMTPTLTVTPTATVTPTVAVSMTATPSPTVTSTPLVPIVAIGPIVPLAAQPTAVAPLPGPTSVPAAGDPHVNHPLLSDSCSACHRGHSAGGPVLRDAWPEEQVCFACHGGSGPGSNVQSSFSYNNSPTAYFKHDIAATNGVHWLNEASSSLFGGANRHVECEDCHDPHDATRGTAGAPALQLEMKGASGVDPVWSGGRTPAGYVWLPEAQREYQVCFKCHSSFTALPTYSPDGWNGSSYTLNGLAKLTSSNSAQVLDSRDMALEFNPSQSSFHPVVAQGRNQNIPANTFVNGWTQTSLTYCSDCHVNAANPAAGPHGSPRLHILAGGQDYSTTVANGSPRVSSQEVCFLCHNYQTYVTGQTGTSHFNYHEKHMDNNWGTTCYTCHDSHGSEQQHLINFDTSVVTIFSGYDSQTAWFFNPSTGRAGCYLQCHGDNHNPEQYTP